MPEYVVICTTVYIYIVTADAVSTIGQFIITQIIEPEVVPLMIVKLF